MMLAIEIYLKFVNLATKGQSYLLLPSRSLYPQSLYHDLPAAFIPIIIVPFIFTLWLHLFPVHFTIRNFPDHTTFREMSVTTGLVGQA